tara:strand:- start:3843 stop:5222 length:1380 start_codon:yes stop_codon:yes gene_type:complete
MATNYIKTMKDLEASTYGGRSGVGGNTLLKSAGVVMGLHTGHGGTESPQGTAASGIGSLYNLVYGKKVWSMLNQEVNALAMLPKRPYTSSGWRVMTDRPSGGSASTFATVNSGAGTGTGAIGGSAPRIDNLGGVVENARLGTELKAMAPSYTTLYTSPKTVAHMFEFSELALEMAKIDDGVGDLRALIREDMGKHHAEVQNKMLLMPLEDYDQTDGSAVIDVTANYTSLMKIVASSQEIEAMEDASLIDTGASTSGGIINQLVTLYGNTDRQIGADNAYNASFMDAQVDYGSGYASGDARPLTLTILNSMLRSLRENGGSPKVILTGYDTIQHLGDLLQSQERFLDRKEIIPTHGGVRGVKGTEVGFRVATYYDIPLIPCKDMPKTGNGSNKLSDMLILDTDHLWLSVLKPTQYFEDGIDNGNPFGVGTLGNQAMYRTIAETGCSFFKGQGKITNITSA